MRRFVLTLALFFLLWGVGSQEVAAQPAIGTTNYGLAATNDQDLSLTNITNGSGIVVMILQSAGGNRSYTVSDNEGTGNVYSTVQDSGCNSEGPCVIVFRDLSVASSGDGTLTLHIEQSATLSGYAWGVWEIEPTGGKTLVDDADEIFDDTSADTTTFAASAGNVDTAPEVFLVTGCVLSGTAGTESDKDGAGSTWINWETNSTSSIGQYTLSAAGFTDERAEMTTSNSRTAICAISATAQTSGGASGRNRGMLGFN